MNDEPRRFIMTSHGALHRPGCRQLKRLTKPTREITFGPNEQRREDASPAECCWQYGSVRPISLYEWQQKL